MFRKKSVIFLHFFYIFVRIDEFDAEILSEYFYKNHKRNTKLYRFLEFMIVYI